MLNLTFLGTSAGVPTKSRNVTGLAIECLNPFATHGGQISPKNRPWVLVDCGEATQHQLLKINISSQQLRVICITHVHGDHCYGLPGLLASMAMSGRKDTLTIIAPKTIKQFLEVIQQTTQLYLPFNIEFIAIEHLFIANTDVQDKVISDSVIIQLSASHRLVIEVVRLSHRVASYAFKFTQTLQTIKLDIDKLKAEGIKPSSAWGRLQAGEDVVLEDGRQLKSVDYTKRNSQSLKVVVAGDNDTPALLSEAVANTDLLVHESTYTQAVADKIMSRPNTFDPMHTTAKSIAKFAQNAQVKHLILTHFSARYQSYDDPKSKTPNMADIRMEVEQLYQGQLWLARDFMRFEVNIKGVRQLATDQ